MMFVIDTTVVSFRYGELNVPGLVLALFQVIRSLNYLICFRQFLPVRDSARMDGR